MIRSDSEKAPVGESHSFFQNVLFLCTGNYYRSRFAEELFNYHASVDLLPWKACSLGFTPHPHINPGTMSVFAHRALESRKIIPRGAERMPAAVRDEDFLQNKYCIALSENEHRPMMRVMFPQHLSQVRFWQIEDLAWESPESATTRIEVEVRQLLRELQQSQSPPELERRSEPVLRHAVFGGSGKP